MCEGIGGGKNALEETDEKLTFVYGRNGGLPCGCGSRCGNQMIVLTPNSLEMEFTGLLVKTSGASEIQE